jgi:tRNA-2-methylthio-N6-dimethylallyladenosine synthase
LHNLCKKSSKGYLWREEVDQSLSLSGKMPSQRTVYIKSYGCQMNAYDATRMLDVLKPLGYQSVSDPSDATLLLFNTCHIREKAAEKLYSDLGRMRQLHQHTSAREKPILGVGGCVAQAEGQEVLRRSPFVDMVFGPQVYHLLPQMLKQVTKLRALGERPQVLMLDFPEESKFDHLPEETIDKGPVSFLSVQEGCDKFCTYCCVPYTRGIEISRPIEGIIQEARKLVLGGARELVLLGQNVSGFHGIDANGETWGLGKLIRVLAEQLDSLGLKRIRYTTSHPNDTQDDLIEAHRDVPHLMPFLHLPVQSGSDNILKKMNRRNTASGYLRLIERFRAARPGLALSSDFIVGFPGETEVDFEATLALVKEANFSQAYSFKYSPRPGTPAADWDNQVPEDVKSERLGRLQKLLNESQQSFNQECVGKTLPVLFERPGTKPDQWVGRSPHMQSVHVVSDKLSIGSLQEVLITEGHLHSLKGTLARSGLE